MSRTQLTKLNGSAHSVRPSSQDPRAGRHVAGASRGARVAGGRGASRRRAESHAAVRPISDGRHRTRARTQRPMRTARTAVFFPVQGGDRRMHGISSFFLLFESSGHCSSCLSFFWIFLSEIFCKIFFTKFFPKFIHKIYAKSVQFFLLNFLHNTSTKKIPITFL
jgi:hypothetical protein